MKWRFTQRKLESKRKRRLHSLMQKRGVIEFKNDMMQYVDSWNKRRGVVNALPHFIGQGSVK